MALSTISGTTGITDATITSAKLADFSAAVDLNGVELILDADQDTSITADTDDRIDFKIAGVEHISISNSSGDTIIKPMVDAKDIVFQQYDGNKILEINDGNYVAISGAAAGPGELRFYEDTDLGSHYTGLKAGNATASISYVLPLADGTDGYALTTDGSGTLSWAAVSANTPTSADGQALGSASLEWSDLFLADGGIIKFGNDQDVTLTHVADTGILLNSTMAIQFNDASQYINAPSNAILDINATDEIELNATLVDINANVEISGTATTTGVHTFTAVPVLPANSIDSAHYVDGSIDNAHIADDQIDSEHYAAASIDNEHLADNAVDTAEMADNAVTLAKMAGLARGKIIYGDSSGDPAALAVGSSGQALVSDGTDISWGAAGAALTGSTNNNVVTVTGANAMQGEGKFQYSPSSGARVTIGDGTAEDAYVLFDGNAQDYYVGIDDTYDTLSIGMGSNPDSSEAWALGTWDGQTAIRKSLQPCFSCTMSSDMNNISAQIYNTLTFDTESFDIGSNWNSTTNAFTAPISGKWLISCTYYFEQTVTNSGYILLNLTTSNRSYYQKFDPDAFDSSADFWASTICHVADFDTDDTMSARFKQSTSPSTMDFKGGVDGCRITGYMLG